MINLIRSRNLAIGLTLATLVSEMWRSYLDAMFVLPVDFSDQGLMQLAALVFTVLFGVWGGALAVAWRGSRKATIVTFGLNILVLLAIPVSWLLFYCTAECQAEAGIFNLANNINLILGLLAAVALGLQIWQSGSTETADAPQAGATDAA